MVCNHVAQELPWSNTKRTFGSIKSQLVSLRDLKDIPEVIDVLKFQLEFNHHVIYIDLNVFPYCGSNILVIILW